MRLPHWYRYLKLVRKIRKRLPIFHWQTGRRTNWTIRPGYYRAPKRDVFTGSITGVFVPRPITDYKSQNPLKMSFRGKAWTLNYPWLMVRKIERYQRTNRLITNDMLPD